MGNLSKSKKTRNQEILASVNRQKSNYKPYQDKDLNYFIKGDSETRAAQRKPKPRLEKQTSLGERLVAEWLVKNNIRFKREKEFLNCVNPQTGKVLPIDFYLHAHKICIEFDGRQHYKASKLFDRNGDSLEARTQRDRIKDAYCANNGIKMIRIRYNQINTIAEVLKPHFVIV